MSELVSTYISLVSWTIWLWWNDLLVIDSRLWVGVVIWVVVDGVFLLHKQRKQRRFKERLYGDP